MGRGWEERWPVDAALLLVTQVGARLWKLCRGDALLLAAWHMPHSLVIIRKLCCYEGDMSLSFPQMEFALTGTGKNTQAVCRTVHNTRCVEQVALVVFDKQCIQASQHSWGALLNTS